MITLWTKPGCGHCIVSLRALESAGLSVGKDFVKRNVMDDPGAVSRFQEQGVRALPIFEVGGKVVHSGLLLRSDVDRLVTLDKATTADSVVSDSPTGELTSLRDEARSGNFSVAAASIGPVQQPVMSESRHQVVR